MLCEMCWVEVTDTLVHISYGGACTEESLELMESSRPKDLGRRLACSGPREKDPFLIHLGLLSGHR